MKSLEGQPMHFIFYAFTIFIYTVGVFVAGLFIGQWLERVWIADHHDPSGRLTAGPKNSIRS
jgi:hypothetical protein